MSDPRKLVSGLRPILEWMSHHYGDPLSSRIKAAIDPPDLPELPELPDPCELAPVLPTSIAFFQTSNGTKAGSNYMINNGRCVCRQCFRDRLSRVN